MAHDNPLLVLEGLPRFLHIEPAAVVPALDVMIASTRAIVEGHLARAPGPDWDDTVGPLEAAETRLKRFWSPIAHLNAVADSPPLREAYNAGLSRLTSYQTGYAQDDRVYRAYQAVAEGPAFGGLSEARRKVVTNALRDMRLSGVALPAAPKARFKAVQERLSELTSRFEQNVLDATDAFSLVIEDETRLHGIPASVLAPARAEAQRRSRKGFLLTLQAPCYVPVMTYAQDRALRREIYEAYVTRASERGDGRYDNTALGREILTLRAEAAALLGYSHYAAYSLATKMARDTAEVEAFLTDLARRARPAALKELADLEAMAQADGVVLEAWDMAYYSERLKERRYQFSEEDLRPYFPLPRVLEGLFTLTERLYGVRVERREGVEVWHPDVLFYEIVDADGAPRAQFYLDLYARERKRGGAWMDECCVRQRYPTPSLPVAYLTCNFSAPADDHPSLLRHDEVETLFHEFGHGLHHMLTRVDEPAVSGINGVPWDAVELPSQFMENFCWERDVIDLIGGHYRTGAPVPADLFARLRATRTFQAALQILRQVEFALFDIRLHAGFDPAAGSVHALLDAVRDEVAVVKPPAFNRFENSFTHIFAGGYAAGYYSYKWAEVLSADAFGLFEERGVFDRATGLAFLHNILERGGEADPRDLFERFRGRAPRIDALLKQSGLYETEGNG
ncbi:M3 family metallopeptidase [Acidiferrobacter sp.]|uniref:M3 family metallopeptidase n=1 Tax=Acidiferrobacter sp. TaxID=1872107 RepID=UPI002618FE6D|nr:M3 family metallopeptidase [Acidiferrobacter sp.]